MRIARILNSKQMKVQKKFRLWLLWCWEEIKAALLVRNNNLVAFTSQVEFILCIVPGT